MIWGALFLAGSLLAFQKPVDKPDLAGAAERVTLRDGSTVLGLVTSVGSGPRGVVDLLVRREWAESHVKTWAARWDHGIEAGSRMAARQRRQRLASWRRERAPHAAADDRIISWIDQELKLLDDPSHSSRTPLMPVHVSRSDVRSLARQPASSIRLLQLGWICGLPDVEAMKLDDLKNAVESRGFAVDGDRLPSLAGLLPLAPESDLAWLGRRAATELTIDSDLRFVRYHGMILPDLPAGQAQAFGGLNLATALGELSKLLAPEQGGEDPLAATLRRVGDRGRIGALLTRLEIPADLAQATVETTLWVRTGADRWIPFVTRSASVRPEELAPRDGQNLAGDPQVQSAFAVVESLGLGNIPPELKERSLRMGAATEKALGAARSAISQDLSALSLPVFDRPGEAPHPRRARGKLEGPGIVPPAPMPGLPGPERNPGF
jgi:hypothetical protein